MKLIDVIGSDENKNILDEFVKDILITDDHKNRSNYKFIIETKNLKQYYHRFTMLINEKNDIVSIQGIRHSPRGSSYPKNISRIADRHYVNIKYRGNHNREPVFSKYCLKSDIEYLKNNHPEVDTVFISMEGTRGYKFFKKNTLPLCKEQGFEFVIDSNFYQTCNSLESKSCWQTCAYYNVKEKEPKLSLPFINYKEWTGKK